MTTTPTYNIRIGIADKSHLIFVDQICSMIEKAAHVRGTGIAKRSPEYLERKIIDGKAIIAIAKKQLVGFCYIETWGHGLYAANSGLIVHPGYQGKGLGKMIKKAAFELSRKKFPDAKLFGITTSLAVMKINSSLGYEPVTFSELTSDEQFWQGCSGCVNYDILNRTNHQHCLCTGMLYDPEREGKSVRSSTSDRWNRFRTFIKKYKYKYKNGKRRVLKKITGAGKKQSDQNTPELNSTKESKQ